jgi:hypothetical protein
MDPRTVIAQRIDLHLRRQLGEAVDMRRALNDERYARDLLFVCEAMRDTELPLLARQFRAAGRLVADQRRQRRFGAGRDAGPPQEWAVDTLGFGVSQPPADTEPATLKENQGAKAPWFSTSRGF